jgi:uncharacterized protein
VSADAPARRCVIWRIVDGKPGHENQTRGLARSLAARLETTTIDIRALAPRQGLVAALRPSGRIAARLGAGAPRPDLVLCAGHATHLTALAARRRHGGRVVVLMKPSLPCRWFDLCLVPAHDGVVGDNVVTTVGALNDVVPGMHREAERGLVLLGGPSRHAGWDTAAVCAQVQAIAARDPRQWTVATSRRTPDTTLQALAALDNDRLLLMPWQQAPADWLREQLGAAETAWVSPDSVSMVYEALSSGAACGLLRLPAVRQTRVMAGLERLLSGGRLVYVDDWLAGTPMPRSGQPLQEAQRCADLIADRWFTGTRH